jgi:transcriptional regulator with XRE-family HTH domain
MARPKQIKTLNEWRAERSLTVQQLADLLGVSKNMVAQYLQGRREPGIKLAYRFAEALKIDVTQVADWRPDVERVNVEQLKVDT